MIMFPYHSMLIEDLNPKLTLNTTITLTDIIQWFMNHSLNTIRRTRTEYPVGWDNRLLSRGTDSCFGLRGDMGRIRPCVMSTFRYKGGNVKNCATWSRRSWVWNIQPPMACLSWLPLSSSGQSFWLQIHRSRVWFQVLPDFLRSRGSGTGPTQPHEDNWGATCMKK
jgi:hypothetical protein